MRRTVSLLFIVVSAVTATAQAPDALPLSTITLPPGFKIDVYASNLVNPRQMVLSPGGTLFVGSMRLGGNEPKDVYAVVDTNKDNKADEVHVVAKGLHSPNGVAFRDGALYIAEMNRLLRIDKIEANLKSPRPPVVVTKLPGEAQHGWKFIAFGPDGKLYVPVGAPCNICEKDDPYSSITRLKPDGSAMEVFARGVRNSVGFDWHPESKELWFTDNGRDMMGDDVPPDELNRAERAGMHFGYPYCHGTDIADPEFGKKRRCAELTPPAQNFGAHVASLGMRFYTGAMFPAQYRNRIFIAEHGSWNRSKKSGYRVMQARVEGGKVVEHSVFAEGFLDAAADTAWGRPVDVLVMPDGALLVSDDQANAIYRITYKGR